MGKRSISDDDIVRIFNTVKAMNPGPFKITDVKNPNDVIIGY